MNSITMLCKAPQLSLSLFIGLDYWKYFSKCHLNSWEIKYFGLCEMFGDLNIFHSLCNFSSPFFCPTESRLSFFLTEVFLAGRKIRSCLHDTLLIWHLFPKTKLLWRNKPRFSGGGRDGKKHECKGRMSFRLKTEPGDWGKLVWMQFYA